MSAYNTEDLSRVEPDYLESYGLHEAPFNPRHQDKYFYTDAERAQALNLLQHLTHYSNLLLIVQGEQGVGKTAMLQRFVKNAETDWRICEVNANTMMDAEQLLFQAAQGFGVTQLPEDSGQLQEMLYARVATLHHNEQAPILIIDDAHLLPKDALLAIFNLADAYVNDVNLLRIILFADPIIEKILNSKEVRPLRERITHTMEVTPFNEEATADYLKHRLAVAGLNSGSPFTPKMIKKLYRSSRGVAAKINEFAHQMLSEGDIDIAVEIPEDVVSVSRQSRNNLPIVFISVAVLAIALVLVFQDNINSLFEGSDTTAQTETPPTEQQPVAAARGQDVSEQPLQEKIIPLREEAVTSETVQATENTAAVPTTQTVVTPSENSKTAPASDKEVTAVASTSTPAVEPGLSSLQLHSVEPDPVPARNQRQSITISGQGFTPQSEVMVNWANKQKKLDADQIEVKSDSQIVININVGKSEEQWSLRVMDPAHGQSNIVAFDVKTVMLDDGMQREKWIASQNPENFTLQLFGSHDKHNADVFIQQHKLSGDVGYFESTRNNKPWYSVVYGSYADQTAAKTAVTQLPASLKKVKPWVRRFDDIQASINTERVVNTSKKPVSVATTSPVTKTPPGEGNNEAWIWSQNPSSFTLQLLGARQSDSIQKFLRKYSDLNGKAVYFHTRHDPREWYTVVYGVYPSKEQAQQAIKRLPAELQSASPWVRSFGSIHAELDRTDQ